MARYANIFKSIPKRQIDDLTAIYNDYLFIARNHEQLLNTVPLDTLALLQIKDMDSKDIAFSWDIITLTDQEKQEYADFINNDVSLNDNRVYITLRHINPEQNKGFAKDFAIPPYDITDVNMQIPSCIERFAIFYPVQGNLKDAEFFVDGEYKIIYTDKNAKNISLNEFINGVSGLSDFCVVLNITDGFIKNGRMDKRFNELLVNACATARVEINESNILELIGSFAEKVQEICRKRYNTPDTELAFQKAEAEGLIKSAKEFQEYMHLRHFLRHQWDTLDGLGRFSPKQAEKNKSTRNEYVKSYLNLCDKTLVQRMKTYIDVLHQMQHVIASVNPNWIIREGLESNNKFFQRVKSAYWNNPKQHIKAEINYPLFGNRGNKYEVLNRLIHKFFPNVQVADEFLDSEHRLIKVKDYNIRSIFLQTFKTIECMVMRHCIRRGENLGKHEAWDRIQELGLISAQESLLWKEYSEFRNLLSHNYFSDDLRKQLLEKMDKYEKDSLDLRDKLVKAGPSVFKIQKGVYEYRHNDGLNVEIDYNLHTVAYKNIFQNENEEKRTTGIRKEFYTGGVEFTMSGRKIINVQLPTGIIIDLDNKSVSFGKNAVWKTNDKHLNGFITEKSKVITNKNLHVLESREKNNWQIFEGDDDFLIDYKYAVRLDSNCDLQEIKFKNAKNNLIRARLVHAKDGHNVMLFNDGTIISQSESKIIVIHDGWILDFYNRQKFAATYIDKHNLLRQNLKTGKSR